MRLERGEFFVAVRAGCLCDRMQSLFAPTDESSQPTWYAAGHDGMRSNLELNAHGHDSDRQTAARLRQAECQRYPYLGGSAAGVPH